MAFYIGEIVKLREDFFEAHKNGDYMEAVVLGKQIMDLYRENDDCHTMEYATDLNNLAIAYDDIGLYDKACSYYESAAKLKKELTGESLSYADTLNNLAITYSNIQKFAEAVTLQKQVLDIRERLLGRNHVDYIMSLYNIGNAYEDAGNLTKALELHQKALSKARRHSNIPGMDYSDILTSLGRIYEKTGCYKKSLDSYKKSLETIERDMGPDNFFMMSNLVHAAAVAERANLLDISAQYCKKAVEVRRKMMDKNHLDYIANLNTLAAIYCKNGKFEDALEVHNEVLSVVETMLGKDHIFYADTLNNISVDYCGLEEYDKALEINQLALDKKISAVGEHHAQYALSLLSMGTIYDKMGNYEKALDYYRKALEVRNEVFHGDDASCADVLVAIGKVYAHQNDYVKAAQYYADAIGLRRRIDACDDDGYIWSMQLLGHAKACTGDEAGAMKSLWDAADLQKKHCGTEHPKYARALVHLGRAYMLLERYQDAAYAFKDAAEIEETTLGEQNPRFLGTLEELALAQYKSGEFLKAVESYKKYNDMNFEETVEEQVKAAKMELCMSNCYLNLGEKEKALAYYQKATEKIERCGGKQDEEWLEFLQERRVIAAQKNHQKSEQLLKKVQSSYGKMAESPMAREEIKQPEIKKIFTEGEKQQLDEASQLLIRIYDLRTSQYGLDDKEALEAAVTLGDLYKTTKQYEDAMFWYQKVEKQGDSSFYANASRKAGILYLEMKDYDRAMQKLVNTKNYIEEYDDVKSAEYLETIGYIGDIFIHRNEPLNAARMLEAWMKLKKEINAPKAETDLDRMECLAGILIQAERTKDALECYSELALEIRECEGESLRFARIIIKIANLYMETGQLDASRALLERAASLYQADKGENNASYGKIRERLGNLYFHQKEWEKAEMALEEAFSISRSLGNGTFFSPKSEKQLSMLIKKRRESKRNDDNPWDFFRNLFGL